MPEFLKKRLVALYTEDPVVEELVRKHRGEINFSKSETESKYEDYLGFVMGAMIVLTLGTGFGFLVYWYCLDFSTASIILLGVLEVLYLLVGIPLYAFIDEVKNNGKLLNLAAKKQFRKEYKALKREYKQIKKHSTKKFLPEKIFKLGKRGTSDSTSILLNDKYVAFSGEGATETTAMTYSSILSYRVIENDRTVFLSRRGCEASGLEYFGLREESEAVSKDFEGESEDGETVRSIYIGVTYSLIEGKEEEMRLPFSVTELDRDSVTYNNALSKLLHVLRELEFIINQSKTFIGE